MDRHDLQIITDGSAHAEPLDAELGRLDDAVYYLCLVLQGEGHQLEETVAAELRDAFYPGIPLSEMDELYRIDHWQRVWKPLLDKAIQGLDETPGLQPDKDIISRVCYAVVLAERMRDEYGRAAALWLGVFGCTEGISTVIGRHYPRCSAPASYTTRIIASGYRCHP